MSEFAFAPPGISSVAIAGESKRFPVRRIFCVGRNYAAHAREMGRDPDREPPFFFTKPADTVVDSGAVIPYPPQTKNFHYEIELVVGIGKGGAEIPTDKALDHVWGYGVGIDLTRRDLQLDERKGPPLGLGKGVRSFRALRASAPSKQRRPPGLRPYMAGSERGGETEC